MRETERRTKYVRRWEKIGAAAGFEAGWLLASVAPVRIFAVVPLAVCVFAAWRSWSLLHEIDALADAVSRSSGRIG